MHIRLLAVGDRQPAWVDEACTSYASRLPRQWQFRLESIATAARGRKAAGMQARSEEAQQLLARVKPAELLVALDERGTHFSTSELCGKIDSWQSGGRDLVLVVGGPDGLDAAVMDRAELRWSLSRLTLPHGLARVLAVEQLYRAWSLGVGHPYHRE